MFLDSSVLHSNPGEKEIWAQTLAERSLHPQRGLPCPPLGSMGCLTHISAVAYSGALILVPSLSLWQNSSLIWTPGYGDAPKGGLKRGEKREHEACQQKTLRVLRLPFLPKHTGAAVTSHAQPTSSMLLETGPSASVGRRLPPVTLFTVMTFIFHLPTLISFLSLLRHAAECQSLLHRLTHQGAMWEEGPASLSSTWPSLALTE